MVAEGRPQAIGLALSGGGHRATLAAIGSMLALVDGGLNADVHWITSVSGGSIANAFVSTRCGFRDVSASEFETIVRDAVDRVVRQGSLAGTAGAKLRAGAAIAAGAVATAVATRRFTASIAQGPGPGWIRRSLMGGAARAVPAVAAFRSRGWLVEQSIAELWCRRTDGSFADLTDVASERRRATTANEAQRTVEHVYVAADLRSGSPLFLTSEAFVQGDIAVPMARFPLARAVRASASFPGLLPPLRLRHSRYARPGAWQYEWGALAVDGGVYNNLASDWDDPESGLFFGLTERLPRQPVEVRILVDAGKRLPHYFPRWRALPFVGLASMRRTAAVMYEAGLESRRRAARSGMRFSTGDIREILVPATGEPRSPTLLPAAMRASRQFWDHLKGHGQSVPTTLRRLREEQAVALVAMGYYQTIASLVEAGYEVDRFGDAWREWLRNYVADTIRYAGRLLASAESRQDNPSRR